MFYEVVEVLHGCWVVEPEAVEHEEECHEERYGVASNA